MDEAAGREARLQAPDELIGLLALGGADGGRVPFRRFVVVDRHEGRLATHGEPDVLGGEDAVDLAAEPVERGPGLVRERLRNARVLGDAGHAHIEAEIDVGEARHA